MGRVLSSNIVVIDGPDASTTDGSSTDLGHAGSPAVLLPLDSPITQAIQQLFGHNVRVLDRKAPHESESGSGS